MGLDGTEEDEGSLRSCVSREYCGEEVSAGPARIEAQCEAAPGLAAHARKPSQKKTCQSEDWKHKGRPKGDVWREFSPLVRNKTTVTCRHCGEAVSARAARVSAHLARCRPDTAHSHTPDWRIRLLEFVIQSLEELLNCQSYETLNGEMKQRVRHLYFITELGHRGNKTQIARLLEEHQVVLDDINNGSVLWSSEQYFQAMEDRVLQNCNIKHPVKEDLSESISKFEEEEDEFACFVKFEKEEEVEIDYFHPDSNVSLPEPTITTLEQEKKEISFGKTEDILKDQTLPKRPSSSVGRPKGGAWNEFSSLQDNKTNVRCRHCGEEVSARLARLNVHLEKCSAVNRNTNQSEHKSDGKEISSSQEENVSFAKPVMIDIKTKKKSKGKSNRKENFLSKRREIRCDSCKFVTRYERRFEKHCFENHEQTMCSDCGLNFTDFKKYRKHTLSHRDPTQCPQCPQQFLSDQSLRSHVRHKHENSSPRKVKEKEICPTCGKYVQNINTHMKIVHQALVPCPYCGKSVKKLRSHIDNTQCNLPEDQRKIEMAQCPYCYKQIKKSKLKAHIRILHEERNKYCCDQCGYTTGHKFNLDQHVKRHEGKPLKEMCSVCNKECVSLEWHIKTYHTSISMMN